LFFRAKELEDAIKVLKGMFGFTGIILPGFLSSKLNFLLSYGIEFHNNYLKSIYGSKDTIVFIFSAFVIILLFKNSMELKSKFQVNIYYGASIVLMLVISWLHLSSVSTFLYFNF